MNNQQGQQSPWPLSHPSYGQPNPQSPHSPSQWQQPPSQSLPPQQQWQPSMYQPQIPPPQMVLQKPKSRKRLWLIIGAMILVLIVIGTIASQAGNKSQPATTSQATQPASTGQQQQPRHSLQWTTVQTNNGNGSKKTAIFTAPADWKIVWSCTGQNIDGVKADGLLVVSVYNAGGSIADPGAVDATCKAGQTKTTGETEEHQGGQVYLSVVGTGAWTIQIQE